MRSVTLARKSESARPSKASASMEAANALRIGEPCSAFEQEADRLAHEVTGGAPGKLRWSLASIGTLQAQSRTLQSEIGNGSSAPPIVREVLHSPGQPLDSSTCTFM